ncbi:aplysianin-A-like [Haliotis rubra]|uniref:aplysianin-A-like n=1 Tax=Haliotis rubra TaxID=36100 RepID=UPI001EE53167|nr:aplysianin-A-like [Haliotis rubra]
MGAVIPIQAQKVFLAYPYPWTDFNNVNENITHADQVYQASLLTTGERALMATGSICLPIVMARVLLPSGGNFRAKVTPYMEVCPGARVSTEVRNRLHSYLSLIYRIPESYIPETVGGAMQLWDTYPFRAGWHLYKPGFRMEETRDYMLKPFFNHEVFHVAGSWWPNKLQGWSEAALRAVDLAVKRYL